MAFGCSVSLHYAHGPRVLDSLAIGNLTVLQSVKLLASCAILPERGSVTRSRYA